jgi:hypothetical protein
VLVLAVIAAFVGVWLGGPPIAAAFIRTGLGAAGLHSPDLQVDVRSDPPLELALGHADRVLVDATDVAWNGHHADSLHLTLDDVDLLGRTAARTTGHIGGVELPGVDPPGSTATIDIAGRGPAADVTLTIDRATAEAIAAAAFEQKTGTRPSSTTLVAPNVIRFKAGPFDVSGALTIASDGSLGVSTPRGRVTVLDPDASQPVHLTGVGVTASDLVLTGSVEVASLLR